MHLAPYATVRETVRAMRIHSPKEQRDAIAALFAPFGWRASVSENPAGDLLILEGPRTSVLVEEGGFLVIRADDRLEAMDEETFTERFRLATGQPEEEPRA
jgi:hypothetical protein